MAGPTSVRRRPTGVTPGLIGWLWRAVVAVLVVGAALDVLLVVGGGSSAWPVGLVLLAVVSFVAVRGLRTGRPFSAARWAAGASLIGSAGLVTAAVVDQRWAATDFGLVEGASLTFVLVACFRRAVSRGERLATALVALAVLALPLRLGWIPDVVPILLAAVAVASVAAATGAVLRATDVSYRSRVGAVRRAEREEMARELHDVVAHHVTGMVVLVQAARAVVEEPASAMEVRATVGEGPDPRLVDALAAVERSGAEALISLRSMVAVLRSSDPDAVGAPLEPGPSAADLEEVVRRFRDSGAAARVDLAIEPAARGLPAPVQAAVHRVVQESLTNAARYARGADRVLIELTRSATQAVVTVQDSGGSGDAGGLERAVPGGGFGIVGMRERVGALGGSLEAGPGPGGGWTVRARVPL